MKRSRWFADIKNPVSKKKTRLYAADKFDQPWSKWLARWWIPGASTVIRKHPGLNTLVKKFDSESMVSRAVRKQRATRKRGKWTVASVGGSRSPPRGIMRTPPRRRVVTLPPTPRLTPRGRMPLTFRRRRRRRGVFTGTGLYAGKFKVSKKGTKSSFDVYNRKGVVVVNESTTTGIDVDCVYVINSVMNTSTSVYYSIGAVLRKLFEQAGHRVNDFESGVISVNDGRDADSGYVVTLTRTDVATGAFKTPINYNTTGTSTLDDVIAAFVPEVTAYIAGYGVAGADNTIELDSFFLYKAETISGSASYTKLAQINLGECFLNVKARSEMKVQNRSLAADSSPDAENVTSNPIQGYCYTFNGVPKVRATTWKAGVGSTATNNRFQAITTALQTFGAAASGFGRDFKEPPTPSYFTNVVKAGKVRLEPGHIKSFYLNYEKKMMLKTYWKKLRLLGDATKTTWYPLPCQMIAMEDVININASLNLTLGVELETKIGMYVSTKRHSWCHTKFNQ